MGRKERQREGGRKRERVRERKREREGEIERERRVSVHLGGIPTGCIMSLQHNYSYFW